MPTTRARRRHDLNGEGSLTDASTGLFNEQFFRVSLDTRCRRPGGIFAGRRRARTSLGGRARGCAVTSCSRSRCGRRPRHASRRRHGVPARRRTVRLDPRGHARERRGVDRRTSSPRPRVGNGPARRCGPASPATPHTPSTRGSCSIAPPTRSKPPASGTKTASRSQRRSDRPRGGSARREVRSNGRRARRTRMTDTSRRTSRVSVRSTPTRQGSRCGDGSAGSLRRTRGTRPSSRGSPSRTRPRPTDLARDAETPHTVAVGVAGEVPEDGRPTGDDGDQLLGVVRVDAEVAGLAPSRLGAPDVVVSEHEHGPVAVAASVSSHSSWSDVTCPVVCVGMTVSITASRTPGRSTDSGAFRGERLSRVAIVVPADVIQRSPNAGS